MKMNEQKKSNNKKREREILKIYRLKIESKQIKKNFVVDITT